MSKRRIAMLVGLVTVLPLSLLVTTSASHATNHEPCTLAGPTEGTSPDTGGTMLTVQVDCASQPRTLVTQQNVNVDDQVVFKENDTFQTGGGNVHRQGGPSARGVAPTVRPL